MRYTETFETEIAGEYDVFVLGGGIAGISAALAAARQGRKVLLCEKNFILGGLATSGLITIYLPLCDGMGNQVSFGIAEELLKLSVKDSNNGRLGYCEWVLNQAPHTENSQRYEVDFNPNLFALAAERLLIENGVKVLYGTAAVSAVKEDGKIKAVIVENKGGRHGYAAKSFVDASGDCDLAYLSGTETVNFERGNSLASWYCFMQNGEYELNMLGFCDSLNPEEYAGRKFLGLDGEELSEIAVISHSSMYNDMLDKLAKDKLCVPLTIPTIPQLRMTRRIVGEYTMTHSDMGKHFESSIGMVSDWKCRGPVYEVPFEALYNAGTQNLICAGRCVSNDDYMWDIMRVIPCCAVTGEAAGVAAALSDNFGEIDMKELQKRLVDSGVKLHLKH